MKPCVEILILLNILSAFCLSYQEPIDLQAEESSDECSENLMRMFYIYKKLMKAKQYTMQNCLVRNIRENGVGPFWANRGKRDPSFSQSKLFVEEPRWITMARDASDISEPFFATRGKRKPIQN